MGISSPVGSVVGGSWALNERNMGGNEPFVLAGLFQSTEVESSQVDGAARSENRCRVA